MDLVNKEIALFFKCRKYKQDNRTDTEETEGWSCVVSGWWVVATVANTALASSATKQRVWSLWEAKWDWYMKTSQ